VLQAAGTVSVAGATAVAYRLRVKSFQAPNAVSGADDWSYDAANKVVVIDKQGASFAVTIDGLTGYP